MGFPIENKVMFHSYVKLLEGATHAMSTQRKTEPDPIDQRAPGRSTLEARAASEEACRSAGKSHGFQWAMNFPYVSHNMGGAACYCNMLVITRGYTVKRKSGIDRQTDTCRQTNGQTDTQVDT